MMRLPRHAVYVHLALLTAGACGVGASLSLQAQSDRDRKQLQGKWEIVSIMSKAGKEEFKPGQLLCVVTGDRISSREGVKLISEASFTLDANRSPRTLDLKGIAGEDKGKTFLGIYELIGPDLKMCFGPPNGVRPTEFVPAPTHSLILLKRVKN